MLLLWFPFHRGEKCDSGSFSKLFEVTELERFEPVLNLGNLAQGCVTVLSSMSWSPPWKRSPQLIHHLEYILWEVEIFQKYLCFWQTLNGPGRTGLLPSQVIGTDPSLSLWTAWWTYLTPSFFLFFSCEKAMNFREGCVYVFGLGVQNEAGQRLKEFCQENALVIANTFQQHKRRLYTWMSPDWWHHIDYILCSQRWRSSIQSAKTRPGADGGSDHELLITKFRLNWRM